MFPVQLKTEICFAPGTDKLLLLNYRTWKEAATIMLYRDIDIERPRAIWNCVQTLSLPPGMPSFGRDYALYIHAIRLRHPLPIQINLESREVLAESLIQVLPRLINLRSFSCGIPLLYSSYVSSFTSLSAREFYLPGRLSKARSLRGLSSRYIGLCAMSARSKTVTRTEVLIWGHWRICTCSTCLCRTAQRAWP